MSAVDNKIRVEDIELFAADLDISKAAAIYKEYGCLVIRGLMNSYVPEIDRDVEASAKQAISLLDRAQRVPEGWVTPDGTLFLPAPKNFSRDKQIMVLGVSYNTSSAFFRSSFDTTTVDVVEAILGPNIELFLDGQCLYKEPVGGHPKNLHQDAAYFEHKYEGPVGVLNYLVDTNLVNGALYVIPGSHKLGSLKHIDTFSHLGLDEKEWPWEKALPITGSPGDSIFFHVHTIHGSQTNRSENPRPVFIHRYRSSEDYVIIGAASVAGREKAEKAASDARKENQMGLMVRGFRTFSDSRL